MMLGTRDSGVTLHLNMIYNGAHLLPPRSHPLSYHLGLCVAVRRTSWTSASRLTRVAAPGSSTVRIPCSDVCACN